MLTLQNVSYTKCFLCKVLPRQSLLYKMLQYGNVLYETLLILSHLPNNNNTISGVECRPGFHWGKEASTVQQLVHLCMFSGKQSCSTSNVYLLHLKQFSWFFAWLFGSVSSLVGRYDIGLFNFSYLLLSYQKFLN